MLEIYIYDSEGNHLLGKEAEDFVKIMYGAFVVEAGGLRLQDSRGFLQFGDWDQNGGLRCQNDRIEFYWLDPDYKKIRRRVEDRLRKMDNMEELLRVATALRIKIN